MAGLKIHNHRTTPILYRDPHQLGEAPAMVEKIRIVDEKQEPLQGRGELEYLGYIEGRVEDAVSRLVYMCREKGYIEADMVVYRNQWSTLKITCHNKAGRITLKADRVETRAEELVERLRRLECVLRLYAYSSEKPQSVLDALIS